MEKQLTAEELAQMWTAALPAVVAFVRAEIRNRHDVEDVVQEIGHAVVKSADRYDAERPFLSWVFGVTRRQLLRYYRKQSSDRGVFSSELVEGLATAYEQLLPQIPARREALDQCVEHLKSNQKVAIQLFYHDELSQAEIAEEIGITKSSVGVLLHRARENLKECIRRRLGQGQSS
ncbi:sigma-70 family RNA polymerase sigma factor [Aeoliella mucimassa]|uniref:RNA polymerase sigma factor SigM n=1 Tax=Aeoliella mucimassa TaxID=2527972 RepID=A0A518AND1_9BACT|nr:sigma-70 family RNA polymerase sigma factor [Aeoliella mucimassa]QDU56223.1 RNA polymerase sigma factor SigM [Aeoliella mucimassa]